MGRHRRIVTLEDVPIVFEDGCIRKLATIAELPSDADIDAFGSALRDAASVFARDALVPTDNELHEEIATLLKASEGREYDEIARLLENLSPRARDMLHGVGPGLEIELPLPDAIRDVERRARLLAWPFQRCVNSAVNSSKAAAGRPASDPGPSGARTFMRRSLAGIFQNEMQSGISSCGCRLHHTVQRSNATPNRAPRRCKSRCWSFCKVRA